MSTAELLNHSYNSHRDYKKLCHHAMYRKYRKDDSIAVPPRGGERPADPIPCYGQTSAASKDGNPQPIPSGYQEPGEFMWTEGFACLALEELTFVVGAFGDNVTLGPLFRKMMRGLGGVKDLDQLTTSVEDWLGNKKGASRGIQFFGTEDAFRVPFHTRHITG